MKSFPPFRLDPANQCLWRNEERILLAPKVFSILRLLVENAGRLVTQEQILDGLWKDTYVQPEVLRKYILEIRRALDDPPKNPRFIATYPKRGYQFIAPVTEFNPAPAPVSPRRPLETVEGNVVGRGPIFEELNGCLDAAQRGNRQIVFITGEPGIGKTTLADAFHLKCEARPGVTVARGQCMEGFGGKEAYYPVLDALGDWMNGPDSEAVVEILARVAPAWLIQFPGAVKPERREALQRDILGATRERMVREFCEAVESLTTRQTLVLILEDLHWVDSSTLDLISALGRRRGVARLMVVATYRPVEVILSGSPLKSLKQDLLVHRLCREILIDRGQTGRRRSDLNDTNSCGHGTSCGKLALNWRNEPMDAADFRRLALSLEGAEESSHMGSPDFRVGGRIFATLASQHQGYGNLSLTLEQQAEFVEDAPNVFVPIAGGWGRMGMTHVRLAAATEEVLAGALRTAWKLRVGRGHPATRNCGPGSARHALVVARGYRYHEDLQALRSYIGNFRTRVIIGVDGGANALIEAGYWPHMIIGDMDSVSDKALKSGAELVVVAYLNGHAPGLPRVQDLGLASVTCPAPGTSEDVAVLLADEAGASLIVTVGMRYGLVEFLDKGRSAWLAPC